MGTSKWKLGKRSRNFLISLRSCKLWSWYRDAVSRKFWHFEHENLIETWADLNTTRAIIEVLSGSHNIKTKHAHILDISPILTNILMAGREFEK